MQRKGTAGALLHMCKSPDAQTFGPVIIEACQL